MEPIRKNGVTKIAQDFENLTPQQLSNLLNVGSQHVQWSESDLAALWLHQLSSNVAEDLADGVAESIVHFRSICESCESPVVTYMDLFHRSSCPLALLDAAKRVAKTRMKSLQGTGMDVIMRAIYFLTLAVMHRYANKTQSRLSTESVEDGIAWAWRLPWIDSASREILATAIK